MPLRSERGTSSSRTGESSRSCGGGSGTTATSARDGLLDDLRTIRESLAAHGGRRVADGRIARLERMVALFGFHVATLDVRLHARELDSRARAGGGRTRQAKRGGGTDRARSNR